MSVCLLFPSLKICLSNSTKPFFYKSLLLSDFFSKLLTKHNFLFYFWLFQLLCHIKLVQFFSVKFFGNINSFNFKSFVVFKFGLRSSEVQFLFCQPKNHLLNNFSYLLRCYFLKIFRKKFSTNFCNCSMSFIVIFSMPIFSILSLLVTVILILYLTLKYPKVFT